MRRWISIIWCCSIIVVINCSRPSPQSSKKLTVFVSIPPQKFLVEKICGNRCVVKSFVPPGASPHTFEPKPSQMVEIAKATLYFVVGVEMEHVWLPRIKEINPHLKIVATDSGIIKLPMRKLPHTHHEAVHPTHSEQRDEKHGYYDPHIWLSPALVKKQLRTMVAALGEVDSTHRQYYRRRLVDFEASVDSLEQNIRQQLESCGANRSFLTFHPSWGYFADAFDLEQIAVEIEGKEPGIRELDAIVRRARNKKCGTILLQPQYSQRIAKIIAAKIGATTVIADPLAENWTEQLLHLAKVLCE